MEEEDFQEIALTNVCCKGQGPLLDFSWISDPSALNNLEEIPKKVRNTS